MKLFSHRFLAANILILAAGVFVPSGIVPAIVIGQEVTTKTKVTIVQDKTGQDKEEKETGFEVLFDGSSMKHLRGYKSEEIGKGWKIVEKTLMFDGSGGGDVMTKKSFKSFDLRFGWKISPGGNSGVMYHVGLGDGAPYVTGPEYQVLDDEKHHDGKNTLTSSASLYGLFKAEGKELKKVGQWNTARIVIKGKRIQHWLNGVKVVDVVQGGEPWIKALNASKFKTWKKFATMDKGHIAFQDHGDKVWYKNIRIKPIQD